MELAPQHKFFEEQAAAYAERRDVLCSYFDQLGLSYTVPEGSYFLLVDMSKIKLPEDYHYPDTVLGRGLDFKKCWFMAQEIKVVGIPPSEVRLYRARDCKCRATNHRALPVLLQGARRDRRKVWPFRIRKSLERPYRNSAHLYGLSQCKDLDTLHKAGERLLKLKQYM